MACPKRAACCLRGMSNSKAKYHVESRCRRREMVRRHPTHPTFSTLGQIRRFVVDARIVAILKAKSTKLFREKEEELTPRSRYS